MSRLGLNPNDAMALLGLVLLTIGAWLVYLPAGFIVPGALILAYAVIPDQKAPE